jgi:A/G-specific adenine glycosylase
VVTRADGHVLVRTRPEKGLLGGMTELPSTAWVHELVEAEALQHAPLKAKWRKLVGVVEHGFTHFPLQQTVYAASVPAKTNAPDGMRWVVLGDLHGEALPNVFRKVAAHAGLGASPPSFRGALTRLRSHGELLRADSRPKRRQPRRREARTRNPATQ